MLRRENKIRVVFFFAGLVLYAATDSLTELSDKMRHALLMSVGVITPLLIIECLDG